MKRKTLWLTWLYLFALCAVLGFIPNPPTLLAVLLAVVGMCFFIPGALLLKTKDPKTIKTIFWLSIGSLSLTLITVLLNFTSALMKPIWGTVFYIIMGIVSTPMLCTQMWIISLFGWALLMSVSIFAKK